MNLQAAARTLPPVGKFGQPRVTHLPIPEGCRHRLTRVDALSWEAFDALRAEDGWQTVTDPCDPYLALEKQLTLFDCFLFVSAPREPRPLRRLEAR